MSVPYTFADTTLSGLHLNLAQLDADFAYMTGNPQFNSIGVGKAADGVSGDIAAAGTISDGTGTLRPFMVMPSINGALQTNVIFSGIPSWARRITINFYGIVVSGTSKIEVQVGTSSGFLTNSYYSTASDGTATVTTTTGFNITAAGSGPGFNYGIITLNYMPTAPLVAGVAYWVQNGVVTSSDAITKITNSAGGIAVGGDLTQVKIFTVNGTDTFSGVFGLTYE